jgi:hypothetical protein
MQGIVHFHWFQPMKIYNYTRNSTCSLEKTCENVQFCKESYHFYITFVEYVQLPAKINVFGSGNHTINPKP